MEELTEELLSITLELIEEFGADIVYTIQASENYDTATSSAESNEDPSSFKAIIEDLNGPQFGGNLVQGGDKKLTAAAQLGDAPAIASRVNWGEGEYSVIGTKVTRLAAVPVLFEIHVRN